MNVISRRQLLGTAGLGAGQLALSTLLASEQGETPHLRATAKSVIFLFMSGGPSQVDTFDPKPELAKLAGKDVPDSIAKNVPRIKRAGLHNLMASPWEFTRHGESGIPVSSLLPHTAKHADDLCVIRSMSHRNPVHGPGECVALTGTALGDRPSLGAWSIYGLGSESQNLPSYITMNLHSDGMQFPQRAGWGTGFLPPNFQGTVVDPVSGIRDVSMPAGIDSRKRTRELEMIEWLNRKHLEPIGSHPELEARIQSYEMAFRLQTAAPELFDLSTESKATRNLYGMDTSPNKIAGRGCLLARRMVERGVRFVQLRIGGWDAHGNIKGNHNRMCGITDQPIAALLSDLKSRGLLGSTLVVWGGEFGRTPTMEGRNHGRDHSPAGYTVWLAGGGAKGGQIIGETDPIGYVVTKRPVQPQDLHATILRALGLDAEKLVFNHHGRLETPFVNGGRILSEVFG
ncbi:MAG: DUF1501 domain-containing protein [Verrucomicrobiota bacterium]